jgi:RNA polymerase sigma factor (sigma-70 family)
MDEDDAEQIGFLGLIEAARRYRPGLGAQFSTYAAYWIIQACQRFGPDFAFLIRLPAHVVWPAFRFQWSLEQMAGQVGSEGVRDHLLELEERDPRTARRHRDCARATTVRSLSDRKEPEYHAARQIREVTATSLDDELKREEQAKLMERALDFLPARDAQVLRLRYGFDGCPPQSLQEIADLMGLSRERIRQLQIRAERRLRRVLQDGLHKAKSSKAQKRQQGAVKAVSPLIPGPGTGAAATTQQLSECRGKAENLVLVPVQEGVS